MSKYTTELRYICENAAGYDESKGLTNVDAIIAAARPNIFNFDYPIFDTTYKSVLETKILRHYYLREIGMETVGLWRLFLQRKMNEIMPYYNKLYSSELLQFNPLYNVKYDISHSGSNTGNNRENEDVTIDRTGSNSESEGIKANRTGTDANAYTGSTLLKESDTPQGTVSNLENNTYLTRATKTDETSGNTRNYTDGENTTRNKSGNFTDGESTEREKTGNFTNTDQYLRHVEGNMGGKGFSEMLQDYRKTFLNIDMMVIEELNDLFMLIW